MRFCHWREVGPQMSSRFSLVCVATLLLGVATVAAAGNPVSQVLAMPKASLMLEEGGRALIARRPDAPMVPASTMKILTALAAIQRWGLDHRFHTDFFRSADGWLWVKGWGDPWRAWGRTIPTLPRTWRSRDAPPATTRTTRP